MINCFRESPTEYFFKELVITSGTTVCYTFQGPLWHWVLFLPASVTTMVGSVLWSRVNCEKVFSALVTELCEHFSWRGVEFHLVVIPMGWTWAVWFAQQMSEQLLPDEADEANLRHLSPFTHLDDSPGVKLFYIDNFDALALSQAKADESLARMLGLLETAGVVARAEPSSDLPLGFELTDSGTCWHFPRSSGVSPWPFGSWP